MQIEHQRKYDQNVRDYFRRIKRKTALLLVIKLRTRCSRFGGRPRYRKKNESLRLFCGYVISNYR